MDCYPYPWLSRPLAESCRSCEPPGEVSLPLLTDFSQHARHTSHRLPVDTHDRADDIVARRERADWNSGTGLEPAGIARALDGQPRSRDGRAIRGARDLDERGDRRAGDATDDVQIRDDDGLGGKLQARVKRVVAPQAEHQRTELEGAGRGHFCRDFDVRRAASPGAVSRRDANAVDAGWND